MRMRLDCLQGFNECDLTKRGAIDCLGAGLDRVQDTQINRIDNQSLRQLIDCAFQREGSHRRAGRPIGGHLRPITDHVVTGDRNVFKRITGHCRHATRTDWRTGKRAGLIFQGQFGSDDAAIAHGAKPNVHHRTRSRPACFKTFGARHHHPYRTATLPRKGQRERL